MHNSSVATGQSQGGGHVQALEKIKAEPGKVTANEDNVGGQQHKLADIAYS